MQTYQALAMTVFLIAPTVFAGTNTVSGDLESYYVVPPVLDVSSISAAGPVAHSWSVPYASASASANYGSNQISFASSAPGIELDPYAPFVSVESRWTDTLVITGGSGTNMAVFRFLIQSHISGNTTAGAGWEFNIDQYSFYTFGGFQVGYFSAFRYLDYPFTYGVPFTVSVLVSGGVGVNQDPDSASAGLRITDIVLPIGATISATSGCNWLTNVTTIYPALDIALSGTDVRLHWIQPPNYYLESTTNLLNDDDWSVPTDLTTSPTFQQTNHIEFSSTFPLPTDSPARFFRLRKDPNY